MSYNDKIKQSRGKAYSHAIATKILDLMDKLRMDENSSSARRWIWELLQNAKDVSYENDRISIEINYTIDDCIEFKHNGRVFSVDNLTFLIEQVSTKERKPNEKNKRPSGKFGTGFLTTHLLSEKVEIESFVKEPEMPYKPFRLELDRSGRDIDEIIQAVEKSVATLDTIDSKPSYEQFNSKSFNTLFRYRLDQHGKEVAETGIKDIHVLLPFVLVFLPEIKSVSIKNENTEFSLDPTPQKVGDTIFIYTVTKKTVDRKEEFKIATLSKNKTTIGIQIEILEKAIYLKDFNPSIPKLFCDFPLIGSEDFPLSVIINSSHFNPTEPRNGVFLSDKQDPKISENKEIVNEAIELYNELVTYGSANNWQNLYLLAKLPQLKEKSWLSEKWVETEVLNPIRKKLFRVPIVDMENQTRRCSIHDEEGKPEVYFPYSSKKEVREKIWDLSYRLFPENMPRKKDIHLWYEILWPGCYKQSITALSVDIREKKTLRELAKDLRESEEGTTEWLNSYYDLLNFEGTFIKEIINDNYEVIANQNGDFKKRSELNWDDSIDEELKNVLKILGIDIRDTLRDNRLVTISKYKSERETDNQIVHYSKKEEQIIDEINKLLKDGEKESVQKASDYLLTLFPEEDGFPGKRQMLFDFCQSFYPNRFKEKIKIENWNEKIWQEADKIKIKEIIQTIAEAKDIKTLSNHFLYSIDDTASLISNFISFLTDNEFGDQLNLKSSPILPNQNGLFKVKDDLFLDDDEIDERLKDISSEFGYDFREELLDKRIYLELPENRVRNKINIAEEITRRVYEKLAEIPRKDETKQVFRKLFLWFNDNKEEAAIIFPELYASKHKLYDDEEIAENMQKAEVVSELMKEFGITNIAELRSALHASANANRQQEQQPITQEILASLGVSSIKELEDVLKNMDIASLFVHTSTPTFEMFQYAQAIIERAKENVVRYLENHPDYDCREIEESAPTIFAGVKKKGVSIYVVVRPSDNGEVIIYYPAEKDVLDWELAELWIDNGIEDPRHLTLGRILKTTGINRIPV